MHNIEKKLPLALSLLEHCADNLLRNKAYNREKNRSKNREWDNREQLFCVSYYW